MADAWWRVAAGSRLRGREAAVSAEGCAWLPGALRPPSKGAAAALLQQSSLKGGCKLDVAGNVDFLSGAKNLDFYVSYLSDQLLVTDSFFFFFFLSKKKEKHYKKNILWANETLLSAVLHSQGSGLCASNQSKHSSLIGQAQEALSEKCKKSEKMARSDWGFGGEWIDNGTEHCSFTIFL